MRKSAIFMHSVPCYELMNASQISTTVCNLTTCSIL